MFKGLTHTKCMPDAPVILNAITITGSLSIR